MSSLSKALPPGWVSFSSALSGGAGAAIALVMTYPLDLAKTILQVPTENPDEERQEKDDNNNQEETSEGKRRATTMLGVIRLVYEYEGLSGLYNGLPVGVFQVVGNSFSYFYFYSFIRNYYLKQSPAQLKEMHATLPAWAELTVGGVAGIMAQLVTLPISVAVTRQQTTPAEQRKSMISTWLDIIKTDGYQGLWSGLMPSFVLVINPSITYGVFEKLKGYWLNLKGRRDLTSLEIFTFGAISKSVATIITYPYIMAKVRLQWKAPNHVAENPDYIPYKNSLDVLKRVLKKKGFQGWYEGLNAQITKAVLSQVILFFVKEKVSFSVTMLLIAFRNMFDKGSSVSHSVGKVTRSR